MRTAPVIQASLKQIATLGFIGYMPAAPGTWGSAAGAVLLLVLTPPPWMLFVLVLFLFVLGVFASGAAEKVIGEQDSGHIVIDELVGMFTSVLFLPRTAVYIVPAFFLFRFFDIVKPFPIRQVESRFKGGIGIMADDLLAGVGANLILQVWKTIYQR